MRTYGRSELAPAVAVATAALVVVLAAALPGAEGAARAQPPAPPTAPSGTVGPPPDISGDWSVTRTWLRRCPRCAMPMVRTSPWVISQSGRAVEVDRGPRGTIEGAPGGGGYLALEGTETGGFDVQRFLYSTLYVSPSGESFEGQFGGSERVQNPCGPNPPVVTCLVSAGWVTARRVATPAGTPTQTNTQPPDTPTAAASATTTPTPTPAPPTRTAGPSPTTSSAPSPTATPRPVPLFFPCIGSMAQ